MIKYFNKQNSMKIISYLKKFFIYFCEPILNNKHIIRFIRKPLNTFFFNNLPYKKRALKETKIWRDQSYFKIEFYEEVSSKYIKKFINYILSRTTKKDHILDICCNQGTPQSVSVSVSLYLYIYLPACLPAYLAINLSLPSSLSLSISLSTSQTSHHPPY